MSYRRRAGRHKLCGAEEVGAVHARERLYRALRDRVRRETATVLDVLPPEDAAPVAGLVVDLGTTSVAATLVDMETGAISPRRPPAMARSATAPTSSTASSNPTARAVAERLQKAVIDESLRPLIAQMCAAAKIESAASTACAWPATPP